MKNEKILTEHLNWAISVEHVSIKNILNLGLNNKN